MSTPVLIRYTRDVPAKDGRRAFVKGEEGVVESVAVAERVHPDATVVGYYGENSQVTPLDKPKATSTEKKGSTSEKDA